MAHVSLRTSLLLPQGPLAPPVPTQEPHPVWPRSWYAAAAALSAKLLL